MHVLTRGRRYGFIGCLHNLKGGKTMVIAIGIEKRLEQIVIWGIEKLFTF